VYVTNHGDHTVSVIDTSANEVIGTVRVGKGPHIVGILDPRRNRAAVSEP
jgi:YVTN family beta-propeller protein